MEIRVGSDLGAYRLEEVLGRGGMSTVYVAEHRHLRRKVALKLLSPPLASDSEFRERFLRESRLAASLDHPNIVSIYDAGEAGDVLFIAMRQVKGQNLAQLLASQGRMEPGPTLDILEQVAAALDVAHAHGLIHRDVKPGNILIEFPGPGQATPHCYLSDFGLTKRLSSDTDLTGPGDFAGTLAYVAPEQIEAGPVDGRADVYALGCVLFECLTGTRPYEHADDVRVIYAHLREPPPRLTDRRPDLPSALDDVISTALAKKREDRYPTCQRLVQAARAASIDRPIPPGTTQGRPVPGQAPPAARRRRSLRVVVVAGIAAASLAVAVVALTRSPGAEPGVVGEAGVGDIYRVRVDGAGVRPVVSDPASESGVSFSPDGSQMVFASDRLRHISKLFVASADGSDAAALGQFGGGMYEPAWAPRGGRIAFGSDIVGNRDIYVIGDRGGQVRRIVSDIASDMSPTWSPDGKRLAFVSQRNGGNDIFLMDADGSNVVALTTDESNEYNPAWSPDGTKIAFDSDRSGNVDIYVIGIDGRGEKRLTTSAERDANPAWSPDGARIAFAHGLKGSTDIWLMNANGDGPRPLTHEEAGDQAPAWSPDGTEVFFLRAPAAQRRLVPSGS